MTCAVSTYVDRALARRLERISGVQKRPVSEILESALHFYLRLPEEVHVTLCTLETLGSKQDLEQISREITRLLLHFQYSLAEQSVVQAMKIDGVEKMSEDELAAVAISVAGKH